MARHRRGAPPAPTSYLETMNPERRKEERFTHQDQVVITIRHAEGEKNRNGTTLACKTFDLSPRGLRIGLDQPVQTGSLLSLWLKRLDGPGTLSVDCEVRWHAADPAGEHWVGVQLQETDMAKLSDWRTMLEKYREGGTASAK